jgi:hypothetical protein
MSLDSLENLSEVESENFRMLTEFGHYPCVVGASIKGFSTDWEVMIFELKPGFFRVEIGPHVSPDDEYLRFKEQRIGNRNSPLGHYYFMVDENVEVLVGPPYILKEFLGSMTSIEKNTL